MAAHRPSRRAGGRGLVRRGAVRPAAAVLWVAVGAVAITLVGEWRLRQLEQGEQIRMARDYERLLDPGAGGVGAGPEADARLERDLLWLRGELKLSAEQFAQLKSLHEDSSVRLELLATELTAARATEAHWEAQRAHAQEVDFLSYGFAAKGVAALQHLSAAATKNFIISASAILDDKQRDQYRRLVGTADRGPGGPGL